MIAKRLADVNSRVREAAQRCGRKPDEVTLVAVTKTHPAAVVRQAIAAGIGHIGENRVQETAAKRPEVADSATWHLIGPLQRNKARQALELFDVIHTVDRLQLAERLQYLLKEHWPERVLKVFIEVNIGDEPQKAGVSAGDLEDLAREVATLPQLRLDGLMVIPPFDQSLEQTRCDFRQLADLRNRLRDRLSLPLPDLSMGMSHDYEVAVEEGATLIRVGSAIFGPRRA